MTVSLCVIAYNESRVMDRLLEDIKLQDYPHNRIEVILVNSMSTDNTKEKLLSFAEEKNGFLRVLVLDNPKKKQAAGWNTAIKSASEDIIIRIDAHASIPPDFVRKNVECIRSGEDISGGHRPTISEDNSPWKEALQLAESSMFGSSIAPYRRSSEKTYVKTLFHAAYKREVFENIGGFNENLGRTEDNELHYRAREAGHKFCMNPSIVSYQYTRSSLLKMLKQKYGNGYWVGLTLGVSPGCLSMFHFVPFAFVLGIIITSILYAYGFALPGKFMWLLYGIVSIAMSVAAVWGRKINPANFLLPFIFLFLHISYGIGTAVGLIKMPFLRNRLKECDEIDRVKEAVRRKKG